MQVRPLALALAVLLLLPAAAARLDACDCVRLKPLGPSVRVEAPFIFEGRVVEIVDRSLHTTRTTSGGGSGEVRPLGREVVFAVSRAWAGVRRTRVSVFADEGDCAFPFEVDRVYVVFARRDPKGRPTTSICMRTTESSKAAGVIARLGPGAVPGSL